MADNKIFAKKFIYLMDDKGFKPGRLAKETGIFPSQISRYRRGQVPDREQAVKIADVLGVDVEDIYRLAEPDRKNAEEKFDLNEKKLSAIRAISAASPSQFRAVWASLESLVDKLRTDEQKLGG